MEPSQYSIDDLAKLPNLKYGSGFGPKLSASAPKSMRLFYHQDCSLKINADLTISEITKQQVYEIKERICQRIVQEGVQVMDEQAQAGDQEDEDPDMPSHLQAAQCIADHIKSETEQHWRFFPRILL